MCSTNIRSFLSPFQLLEISTTATGNLAGLTEEMRMDVLSMMTGAKKMLVRPSMKLEL